MDEDTKKEKENSDSTSEKKPKEETPEEKSEGDSKQDIDYYKTELEKKQRELEQAKHVLASKRYDKSQEEKKDDETKEDTEEADERTRRIIREENQRFALVQEKERIDELVSGMSRNEDEKKLILHHLEHSVALAGSAKERVENAYFIANKGLISKQLEELGKAAFSKQTRSSNGGESGQRKENKKNKWDELSEADRRFLQRSGLTQWDEVKQRWSKPK